jgi:hypothetical protein
MALGLTIAYLFVQLEPSSPTLLIVGNRQGHALEERQISTYDYIDETGALPYQVVRYANPKEFKVRRPNAQGGWHWNLADTQRVIYRLPELVGGNADEVIRLCEGDKDADRLRDLGLTATTAAISADTWDSAYTGTLAGRDVVILPDHDEAGRAHAAKVATSLQGTARSVRMVDFTATGPDDPALGFDVSDFVDDGGDAAALRALAERTERWQPSPDPSPTRAPDRRGTEQNLVWLDTLLPESVDWLWPGWLPAGRLVVLNGDPGLGKSTLTLDVAAQITTGAAFPGGVSREPTGVAILSAADGAADTIRPPLRGGGRLIALSTPFGTRGWFYDAWRSDEPWAGVEVPASACPRISPVFPTEEHFLVRRRERLLLGTSYPQVVVRVGEVASANNERTGRHPRLSVDATGVGSLSSTCSALAVFQRG